MSQDSYPQWKEHLSSKCLAGAYILDGGNNACPPHGRNTGLVMLESYACGLIKRRCNNNSLKNIGVLEGGIYEVIQD